MEQVKIDGITYNVMDKASNKAAEMPNLWAAIRNNGWDDQLYVQRPNGTKFYIVNMKNTKYGVQYSKVGRGF